MEHAGRSFLRAAASMLGGSILGQAVWIASSPILTRLYEPNAFGVWVFFMSGLVAAGVLSTLRLEYAIVVADSDEEACRASRLAMFAVGAWTLLSLAVIPLVGPNLLDWLEWQVDPLLLLGIPTTFLLMGPQQVMVHWAIRRQRYKVIAANTVVLALTVNGGAAASSLVSAGDPVFLILGSVSAYLTSNILLVWLLRHDVPWRAMGTALPGMRAALVRWRRFPIYSAPYGIVGYLGTRGLELLIGFGFGATAAGLFGLALRACYLPASLITRPLNQIYFGWLSTRTGVAQLGRTVFEVQVICALVAVPAAVGIALNAEHVTVLLFGVNWEEAGPFIAWLVPPGVCVLLTSWLDRTYDVTGQQRMALALETGFNLVLVLCVTLAMQIHDEPLTVAVVFGVVVSLYNLLWLGITFRMAGFSMHYFYRLMLWIGGLCLVGLADHIATRNAPPLIEVLSYLAYMLIAWALALYRLRRFLRILAKPVAAA